MFETLSDKLGSVLDGLKRRGALKESDVDQAMRDVRLALLEADVALPVVRDFIAKAKERASGEEVLRSVRPTDQVIKITYDGLVEMLGGDEVEGLNLSLNPPTVMMMAGLQGSGKTTTAGRLAATSEASGQVGSKAAQQPRPPGRDWHGFCSDSG